MASLSVKKLTKLTPVAGVTEGGVACGVMTGCAELECLPPFELTRSEGQCCPTCQASDEDVTIDRHTAMAGPSPYAVKMARSAPTSCAGVKCFRAVCTPGYEKGVIPGACCYGCKPAR